MYHRNQHNIARIKQDVQSELVSQMARLMNYNPLDIFFSWLCYADLFNTWPSMYSMRHCVKSFGDIWHVLGELQLLQFLLQQQSKNEHPLDILFFREVLVLFLCYHDLNKTNKTLCKKIQAYLKCFEGTTAVLVSPTNTQIVPFMNQNPLDIFFLLAD